MLNIVWRILCRFSFKIHGRSCMASSKCRYILMEMLNTKIINKHFHRHILARKTQFGTIGFLANFKAFWNLVFGIKISPELPYDASQNMCIFEMLSKENQFIYQQKWRSLNILEWHLGWKRCVLSEQWNAEEKKKLLKQFECFCSMFCEAVDSRFSICNL